MNSPQAFWPHPEIGTKVFKGSYTKILYYVQQVTKRMWFRAFTYAVVGIATAFLGLIGHDLIPKSTVSEIGSEAVGNILTILASSMLAVSTFSLSIMVTAFGNIATGATPRASRLLMENQTAQRAVATFIGAFLYSIVGIIALTTGAYGEEGRFILFAVTIIVIIFIVVTLIRWVDQLSILGRVGNTIHEVESATNSALERHAASPYFDAQQELTDFPELHPLYAAQVGFLALVDFQTLQNSCDKIGCKIQLNGLPGTFLYPAKPMAFLDGSLSEEQMATLRSCFVIEPARTFNQDPRFGFVLLSEIASKALSPAVNDPGTAIQVLGSATRLLWNWSRNLKSATSGAPKLKAVFVPPVVTRDLMGDVFMAIARDGSSSVEVVIKLMRSLKSLANYDPALFEDNAKFYQDFTLEYANQNLKTNLERRLVTKWQLGKS